MTVPPSPSLSPETGARNKMTLEAMRLKIVSYLSTPHLQDKAAQLLQEIDDPAKLATWLDEIESRLQRAGARSISIDEITKLFTPSSRIKFSRCSTRERIGAIDPMGAYGLRSRSYN